MAGWHGRSVCACVHLLTRVSVCASCAGEVRCELSGDGGVVGGGALRGSAGLAPGSTVICCGVWRQGGMAGAEVGLVVESPTRSSPQSCASGGGRGKSGTSLAVAEGELGKVRGDSKTRGGTHGDAPTEEPPPTDEQPTEEHCGLAVEATEEAAEVGRLRAPRLGIAVQLVA